MTLHQRGEKGQDCEVYSREVWQVANQHTPRDARGKPTSEQPWEEWGHPTTGEVHWRHPAMRTRVVGSTAVSVGPTDPVNVAGMEKFHPIAVHEQAHRYEGVINNIETLEDMFLTRRTTLPDGTLEKPALQQQDLRTRRPLLGEVHRAQVQRRRK